MNKKSKALIYIVLTILFLIVVAVATNRFYYSWTDHISLFGCIQKTAESAKNGSNIEQKLDYFTKVKFSYESLHDEQFAGRIRGNPNYIAEMASYRGSSKPLDVTRIIQGVTYKIRFNYVWRQTGTAHESTIYDGIGVSYRIYDAECGAPEYILEKNMRLVINELPLDEELRNEMGEKLSLNFSTQGKSLSFF